MKRLLAGLLLMITSSVVFAAQNIDGVVLKYNSFLIGPASKDFKKGDLVINSIPIAQLHSNTIVTLKGKNVDLKNCVLLIDAHLFFDQKDEYGAYLYNLVAVSRKLACLNNQIYSVVGPVDFDTDNKPSLFISSFENKSNKFSFNINKRNQLVLQPLHDIPVNIHVVTDKGDVSYNPPKLAPMTSTPATQQEIQQLVGLIINKYTQQQPPQKMVKRSNKVS